MTAPLHAARSTTSRRDPFRERQRGGWSNPCVPKRTHSTVLWVAEGVPQRMVDGLHRLLKRLFRGGRGRKGRLRSAGNGSCAGRKEM